METILEFIIGKIDQLVLELEYQKESLDENDSPDLIMESIITHELNCWIQKKVDWELDMKKEYI